MSTKNSSRRAGTLCHRITQADRNLLGCVGRNEWLGMCQRSAAQHGRQSLYCTYCCAESTAACYVATANARYFKPLFELMLQPRSNYSSRTHLWLSNPHATLSEDRLGSVPCCLHPGITSHEDTSRATVLQPFSDKMLRASSQQGTYSATPVLPVRLYDMPECNSSVSIRKVRHLYAYFHETRGHPIYIERCLFLLHPILSISDA